MQIAEALFRENGFETGVFKIADVTGTGYEDEEFDAVISRDVIDHISLHKARRAVEELLRTTRAGGLVIISTDRPDEEYESEPHVINGDGDYEYTDGKWAGMTFHPFDKNELAQLAAFGSQYMIEESDEGYLLIITK